MSAKTYLGQRPADDEIGDCRVTVITESGRAYPLPRVMHHSPTGFEWGYGGSGPADLALSILNDHFANDPQTVKIFRGHCAERAWRLHQTFKFQMLIELPYDRWKMTTDQIDAWLALVGERCDVSR